MEHLKSLNLQDAILVGEEFFRLGDTGFRSFRTTAECLDYLRGQDVRGRTILIKGSRGMKMETLQEVL